MKKISLISFAAFLLFSNLVYSEQYVRYTQEIDTPTAYTLPRATYQFAMLGYDSGGLEFKTCVGLTDWFMLGASWDIEKAIGREKPKPNIPSVIIKGKFTDGPDSFPISISLGWDSFYSGPAKKKSSSSTTTTSSSDPYSPTTTTTKKTSTKKTTPSNQMIYGPYGVITKPFYLFDSEQHFNLGVRLPVQPTYVPNDTSYFVSLDIPVGGYFTFKSELERVYWNFSRNSEWLMNFGLRYNIFTKVGIELNFICQSKTVPNRVIRIEYTDVF